MKIIRYISSDISQEVRPSSLPMIKMMMDQRGPNSLYPFKTHTVGRHYNSCIPISANEEAGVVEYIEGYRLNFTLSQVINILEKAVLISSNTEEGVAYNLEKLFVNKDNRSRAIPPGTLKFFSQKHICFYTGKNWRKITP